MEKQKNAATGRASGDADNEDLAKGEAQPSHTQSERQALKVTPQPAAEVTLAEALLRRLAPRMDAYGTKFPMPKGWQCPTRRDDNDLPLTPAVLAKALAGGNPVGLYTLAAGGNTTRHAVLDFDDHEKELEWATMVDAAAPVIESLRKHGNPFALRSGGGHGIHVRLIWDKPQQAAGVRAMLTDVLAAYDLSPGDGGVAKAEVEIFPKQPDVPEGGYGNLVAAPFTGASVPLDDDLQPMEGLDHAALLDWFEKRITSQPVPEIEAPQQATADYTRHGYIDPTDKREVLDLLVQYYPSKGGGHSFTAALTRVLYVNAGWDVERIIKLVRVVIDKAGDHRPRREQNVSSTIKRIEAGAPNVPGWPTLARSMGSAAADALAMALGLATVVPHLLRDGHIVEAIDAASALLRHQSDSIFQRSGRLVEVTRTEAMLIEGPITRQVGTLLIREVPDARLRELLCIPGAWRKPDARRASGWRPADCPDTIAKMVRARGEWPVPVLAGIAAAPTLRPDGSVLSTPGYDAATATYLDTGGVMFPPVPDQPGKADAEAALERLKKPLEEFPFKAGEDKSVALAAILTAQVRRALPTAPIFGFNAPVMGSGKTLLAEIIAILATGMRLQPVPQATDGAEDKKSLLAVLMAGDPVICIDNCERPLRSDALAMALTAGWYQDRILGVSEMAKVPTNATFLATGNNLTFAGDLTRRALRCTIDAGVERPDTRKFKRKELLEWVQANRPQLVTDVLTILRAYLVAGKPKPDQELDPYGSFEVWSSWVRGTLVWLGEEDPCNTQEAIRTEDPVGVALGRMLLAWWGIFGDSAVTVAEVMDAAFPNVPDDQKTEPVLELGNALREGVFTQRGHDARTVGLWLRGKAGRIIHDLRFVRREDDTHAKVARWAVGDLTEKREKPVLF